MLIVMRVIMPVAGKGTRLKPHTTAVPKSLINVAGRPVLKHVLDGILELDPSDVVFSVGYKKEEVIFYVENNYSNLNYHFIEQKILDGDGSAVRLGLEGVTAENDDEVYVVFGADTLIDFDLKVLIEKGRLDGVDVLVFAKSVGADAAKNYGVLNIDDLGEVYEVEEKPEFPKSDLAIIGAYYFKSAFLLKTFLDDFYSKKETVKGEYKLIQAIGSYVRNDSLSVKTCTVEEWFDCGREEVLLEANRYFLEKDHGNGGVERRGNSTIFHPCFVPGDVVLNRCIVGPHVSIGSGSVLTNVNVQDSIIGAYNNAKNIILEKSVTGDSVEIVRSKKSVSLTEKCSIRL